MATKRYSVCLECSIEQNVGNLFEALHQVASDSFPECSACGAKQKLRLDFPFGLGAGSRTCDVVAAYCPEAPRSWIDGNGKKVEFFPFLVVTEVVNKSNQRAIWLPYWHLHYIKQSPHRKYGQWAPHMDIRIFADLVNRAEKYIGSV